MGKTRDGAVRKNDPKDDLVAQKNSMDFFATRY